MSDVNLSLPLPGSAPSLMQFPVFAKTIRIAVSGDVRVTELEREIIDTPEFQRLRGVRQLGAALRVYPTALHTRFDHSLGSLAMAERMLDAIRDTTNKYKLGDPDQSRVTNEQHALARLYALLHDVAHVPFGHTLELRIFEPHDNNQGRFDQLLGPGSAIGKLIKTGLSPELYERLCKIILTGKTAKLHNGDEFIFHLISNTVCADLLDYILRDSFFCNLDINISLRFMNYLYLGEADVKIPEGGNNPPKTEKRRRPLVRLWKDNERELRRDILTDLGRLLEARYMIAERVYFHRSKITAGAMLGRAVQEEVKLGALSESQLFQHTDDTLVYHLAHNAKAKIAKDLATAEKL